MRISRLLTLCASFGLVITASTLTHAHANTLTQSPQQPSASITGTIGLNTIPSARMSKQGTITTGIATLDPYLHGYIGLQIAESLHINIRQSGQISRINADPERFYPSIDLKLRLLKESAYAPEIAAYLGSAIGHSRMAGEAIIASKKYKDFDFTSGIGWGRLGSAAHISNPLKAVSNHFGQKRNLSADEPNDIQNWFTGEDIGFFGGVEYSAPFLDGLSIKADYNADSYDAEQSTFDYSRGAPWSIGVVYRPPKWAHIDLSLATQGADKLMARLSLTGNLKDYPDSFGSTNQYVTTHMNTKRTSTASAGAMEVAAEKNGLHLYGTTMTNTSAHAYLKLNSDLPATMQLRAAAIDMANHAGKYIEEISITPTIMSLVGPTIHLPRRELEKANNKSQGSAEEIWHNTSITAAPPRPCTPETGFISNATLTKILTPLCHHDRQDYGEKFIHDYKLELKTEFSLTDEDYGALFRTAIIAKMKRSRDFGWLENGLGLRLNLADNLRHIKDSRLNYTYDVRSDVAEFTERKIAIEEAYLGYTHSFKTDLHMVLLGGYLEEMYAGAGGELLYRPLNSRFVIGAEGWLTTKRDPNTALNLGTHKLQNSASGHINAYYDSPALDLTFHGKIGRYLAGDFGTTLSLIKRFRNGIDLEAYATITDLKDVNFFGRQSHTEHGIRLSLPLGQRKYIPNDSRITTTAKAFGRNMGQSINSPLPLYEITEPLSQAHLIRHWDRIVP